METTPVQRRDPQIHIGARVHFMYGNTHVPAIITDPAWSLGDGAPDVQALTVFPVGEPPFTTVATIGNHAEPATWHWPEYQGEMA